MLRRSDIDQILLLRAAASLSGYSRFVMVGTGAVIALTAWREKDQRWLREALRSGIAKADRIAALLQTELSPNAPAPGELARRLANASHFPSSE